MTLFFLFSDLLTLSNILAPVVLSQAKKPYTYVHTIQNVKLLDPHLQKTLLVMHAIA